MTAAQRESLKQCVGSAVILFVAYLWLTRVW